MQSIVQDVHYQNNAQQKTSPRIKTLHNVLPKS